uniref:Uncharacterized protein n=1 Tax=Arundo donax TaxID=35708 RepID=A0A0A8YHV1_ARUDO
MILHLCFVGIAGALNN